MDYRQELEELIGIVTREGASDLHLTVGRPPTIRVTGDLIPLVKKPPLRPEDALGLISEVLSPENKDVFLKNKELDFSYQASSGVRFRGNAFFQRGFVGPRPMRFFFFLYGVLDFIFIKPQFMIR
jgi:twitching motility protein PilT